MANKNFVEKVQTHKPKNVNKKLDPGLAYEAYKNIKESGGEPYMEYNQYLKKYYPEFKDGKQEKEEEEK